MTCNTDQPSAGSKIHLLAITNRHGLAVTAHTTHAGAQRAAVSWIAELGHWDPTRLGPLPSDRPAEAIELYFGAHDDESCSIETTTVQSEEETGNELNQTLVPTARNTKNTPRDAHDLLIQWVITRDDHTALKLIKALARESHIALAAVSRGDMSGQLTRPLTDDEWEKVASHLESFSEHVNSMDERDEHTWLHEIISRENIALECNECGDPLIITSAGISHHTTAGSLDIDHDADADHVAIGTYQQL